MSKTLRTMLLVLLMIGGVINYADRQIIAVLKPVIERDLGWSDTDYGLLVSTFQFAAAFGLLGAGWFIDRVGLRWANPIGVLGWSLSAIAHAFARTLGQFMAARVALGASEATATPAAVKAVSLWYATEARGRALGLILAATTTGAIVTPLFVPPLALALGWRMAFVVVGAAGLVWVGVWVILTAGAGGAGNTESLVPDGDRISLRAMLDDRRTWALAGAKVFSDLVWWVLLFWMPDLFHRVFGLTMANVGVPLAIVYACAAAGALGGGAVPGWLLERGADLNRVRKLTLLVAGLAVLPLPLIVLLHNYWIAVAALGWVLCFHQVFSVNLFATTTDIIPGGRVATVTSIGAFCGNLSGTGILALAGLLLAWTHSYLPLLLLIAPAYLIALAWLHLLVPVIARPKLARASPD